MVFYVINCNKTSQREQMNKVLQHSFSYVFYEVVDWKRTNKNSDLKHDLGNHLFIYGKWALFPSLTHKSVIFFGITWGFTRLDKEKNMFVIA